MKVIVKMILLVSIISLLPLYSRVVSYGRKPIVVVPQLPSMEPSSRQPLSEPIKPLQGPKPAIALITQEKEKMTQDIVNKINVILEKPLLKDDQSWSTITNLL